MVVWQRPNLLVLDEPTNHLDLEMRHAMEVALQAYEGALVLVSHDRHMLRNTAEELLLVHDGLRSKNTPKTSKGMSAGFYPATDKPRSESTGLTDTTRKEKAPASSHAARETQAAAEEQLTKTESLTCPRSVSPFEGGACPARKQRPVHRGSPADL